MKSIPLKVYSVPVGTSEIIVTTYSLLDSAVKQPPQGGWQIEDMRKSMRVLGKMDEFEKKFEYNGASDRAPEGYLDTAATLELEDADFDTVKKAWDRMRWNILSQAILDTDDAIKSL